MSIGTASVGRTHDLWERQKGERGAFAIDCVCASRCHGQGH